jgi:pSer/pThr/pTyr-binding forkhead associated (FHA) protein
MISRLLKHGTSVSFQKRHKSHGLGNMKGPPLIVVQVVHLHGPLKGEIQEFSGETITIGRHPESLLRFPPDLGIVSRKHAEIIREGNRFKLVDLSANGTFVNGKRVKEVYLKDGDVLTFSEGGPKVSFLAQMKEERAETRPVSTPSPYPPAREEVPRVVAGEPASPAVKPVMEEPTPVPVEVTNVPVVFQYGPTLRSFKQLPITLGKHPSCQLTLDQAGILDMHVQIFYGLDRYWVKDLTGKGMVLVNGQPVRLQTPLGANDLISLSPQGPVFRFLGEGRFAEAEEASLQVPDASAKDSREVPQPDAGPEKPGQEAKTGLRRFFR